MADYIPKYCSEHLVRSFFTPPIDYDDVSKQEILTKIKVAETYVEKAYQVTSADIAEVPVLLLVASKLVYNPKISKDHNAIVMEKLGDYQYQLAETTTGGTLSSTPWAIAKSWEAMAIDILENSSTSRHAIYVVND